MPPLTLGIVASSYQQDTTPPEVDTDLWKGAGSVSRVNLPAELGLVDVSWYYDWASYSVPGVGDVPDTPGVQYVPMMWGDWDRDYEGFDVGGDPAESIGPADILLGFNEPDASSQSDMTVARALALWPQLEATGARLGSPAPTAGGLAWLADFMDGDGGGYVPHVDFICVHWYFDIDGGGITAFTDRLEYLWVTYGKPLWITEIGNLSGGFSANAALMDPVFEAVLAKPYVERICWFSLQETGWPDCHLVNTGPPPTLTVSGTEYATFDAKIPRGITPPEPALYEDDFNRADGPLTTPWVSVEGTLAVADNLLRNVGGGLNFYLYDETFADDQWAEADVTAFVSGGTSIGPAVRINGEDLVYLWFSNIPSRIAIWKRVGGTYTQLGASDAEPPTAFKARIEVEGTTYRAYADGELVATGVDDSNPPPAPATGQPGALGANGEGAALDNWRAGDMPYTPGPSPDTAFVGYRTFDAGEEDKVVVSAGESTGQTLDVYSQFALVRPLGAGGGRAYTWFTGERADLSRLCYWYLNWDGYQETDAQSGYTARGALTQVTVADGWIVIGITKASGANPTYHKCLMSSGAWAHESGGGLPSVAPLGAGGHWYLGHDAVGGETWYGDIAAEAFFDRELTTTEVEMLFESLAHWTGLHPVHCWRLDQATITDLVGSADQTAMTGTVLATDFSPLPTRTIYTDDFNRSDQNLADSANWDQMNAQINITGNHLDINSSGCACAYVGAPVPPTSHWSEAMMTIQDGQEGSLGPSVRQGSFENSYYSWLRGPNSPPTFEIWRQWLGGYTQIGGLSFPVPAAKTGPVRVAMEVDGLTIRGYVDGELAIEWVEDNPTNAPTGAYPGINGGMFGATNGLVQCDDWRGGAGRYPGPP